MTHDYERNGTTTLFAALNVLDGTVMGRCMQRHRHQEFIRFLNTVEAAVPAGKLVHAIMDNYAAHKHPKVLAWLARHPRWTFHFTPTSCSWLNAVEGFFATLTKRRLRRGSFASLVELQAAIKRYFAAGERKPQTLRLDRGARRHHREGPARLPDVGEDGREASRVTARGGQSHGQSPGRAPARRHPGRRRGRLLPAGRAGRGRHAGRAQGICASEAIDPLLAEHQRPDRQADGRRRARRVRPAWSTRSPAPSRSRGRWPTRQAECRPSDASCSASASTWATWWSRARTLGDGVNVAARLEQLCEPGGVLVSGTAYDHLQGRLELPLEFTGEQQVKNIAEPVEVYRRAARRRARCAAGSCACDGSPPAADRRGGCRCSLLVVAGGGLVALAGPAGARGASRRSPCCRSPISAATRRPGGSPTGSPRTSSPTCPGSASSTSSPRTRPRSTRASRPTCARSAGR